MGGVVKILLRRIVLLSVPAVVWLFLVVAIDPFDYFGASSLVPVEIKQQNARAINTLFYHAFQEAKSPSSDLLIGDSRTADLPLDEINRLTGSKYKLLTASALKVNEIADLFWLAQRYRELKNVYIGINFSMFNGYAYADRVKGVNSILGNPLRYIFNRNTGEALFYVVEAAILREAVVSSVPAMTRDEFWDYIVTERGKDWYGKYKFPVKAYEELRKLVRFSALSGINLTFIIVPHHVEFQNRVWDFGLTGAKVQFLEAMLALNAHVIDYDYVNEITVDKKNFLDPVHYNKAMGIVIANEVWTGRYKIGKVLDKEYVKCISAKELSDKRPAALARFPQGNP
jgi:hypothetical protein